MVAYILYHPVSENARTVEQYRNDFERFHGAKIEAISLESQKGADLAARYEIVSYPALIVIRDDQQLLKDWQGLPFPIMDEVAGYVNS